jgi:hypothetical protein
MSTSSKSRTCEGDRSGVRGDGHLQSTGRVLHAAGYNDDPQPFRWNYTRRDLAAHVKRLKEKGWPHGELMNRTSRAGTQARITNVAHEIARMLEGEAYHPNKVD